jgi:tetratricopeptide (TPR) repeat protein
VWDEALRIVDDLRRDLVSTVARAAGKTAVAKDVLRPLVEADNPDGLINLGVLLTFEKDFEGASQYFKRASEIGASMGAHNMGALCFTRGDMEAAREWYELACERGELRSIGALGLVYEKLGNQDEAVALWKRGTELGDSGSALHYADWLRSKWQSEESVDVLRVAADGENPLAALSYAGVLLRKKDHETANIYVSKAYEAATKQGNLGDPSSCVMAGVTAYSFGNVQLGEEWWNRARENGLETDWLVRHAPENFPGLQHLAISQDTLDKLGEDEISLLMQILWAGDCLDCGYPLRRGVPALYVDDYYNWADAKLFHFGMCRFPRWNDSALISVAKDVGISWEAFSAGLPMGQQLDDIVPALIVNPSLEAARLILSDQGWTATGVYGPRSSLSEALQLQPFWAGFPPKRADSLAWAFIEDDKVAVAALHQFWWAPAAQELVSLVKQHGGMLLIVTSALGPGPLDPMEVLRNVSQSWDTMTRWVPLRTGDES